MKRIAASCVIRNRIVCKDGKIVFKNNDTGLSDFLLSAYHHSGINYPRFYKMDNLCKLGWLATEILLKDSFSAEDYRPEETGMTLTNGNSSLDTDLRYFETVKEIPSPSLFVYTLPNIMIGEICIRNGFKGESAFFVSDHFDADFMERYVRYLMDNGILSVCICGWVDLLHEEGEAVLFLVEEKEGTQFLPFTKENIDKIFHSENG